MARPALRDSFEEPLTAGKSPQSGAGVGLRDGSDVVTPGEDRASMQPGTRGGEAGAFSVSQWGLRARTCGACTVGGGRGSGGVPCRLTSGCPCPQGLSPHLTETHVCGQRGS